MSRKFSQVPNVDVPMKILSKEQEQAVHVNMAELKAERVKAPHGQGAGLQSYPVEDTANSYRELICKEDIRE
jgi:hypothetical protein